MILKKHAKIVLYLVFLVIFVNFLLKSFKLREDLNKHSYTIYINTLIIFSHISLLICPPPPTTEKYTADINDIYLLILLAHIP